MSPNPGLKLPLQLEAHLVSCYVPKPHRGMAQWYPFCRELERRVERDTTVAGAASELVAALQVILKLPLEQCTLTNRNIFFVLKNRSAMHENFHQALVRHCFQHA